MRAKILVVDDEVAMEKLLSDLLEEKIYDVELVVSPRKSIYPISDDQNFQPKLITDFDSKGKIIPDRKFFSDLKDIGIYMSKKMMSLSRHSENKKMNAKHK